MILGLDAFAHPRFADLRAIAYQIAVLSSSKLCYLSNGSNSAGAALSGAVPHRGPAGDASALKGKSVTDMFADKLAGYILLGVEAELDCAASAAATEALKQAQFVVSMSAFCNEQVKEYADVLLPVAPFSETSGTFVNAEGRWQSFEGAVAPLGEARPGWKVLRVLGNLFECAGFDYVTSREILDEVQALTANTPLNNDMPWNCPVSLLIDAQGFESIVDRPIYAGDSLLRRATSLQDVAQKHPFAIRVNQNVAAHAGLADGEQAMAKNNNVELTLPVVIDERVPDDGVLVPSHLPHGSTTGAVTLSRV